MQKPPPPSNSSRDPPRAYTPEYVKELRKERDLYARTLLNSVGNAQQGANSPPAFHDLHLSGHRNSTAGRRESISRAVTANNSPAGLSNSRFNLSGSQTALHSLSAAAIGSSTDGVISPPSSRTPASGSAVVVGRGTSSTSRPGSTYSLNASNNPHHAPQQLLASGSLRGGTSASAFANTAMSQTTRRRASVISFNSTNSRARGPNAGRPSIAVPAGSIGSNGTPRSDERLKNQGGPLASSSSIQKLPLSNSASKVGTMEDGFDPVVGSVRLQMGFHYLWYGCLLFIGYSVSWIGAIRPVTISIYFATAFIITQFSRVLYASNEFSLIPLYLSFLPFFEFCLLSREGHILFSVLWFISLMIVNMQCGASSLTRHIVASSVCLLVTYVLAVGLMYEHSAINIFNVANGKYIRELGPIDINLASEGTFLVFMVLLQLGLFMLQRFIKRYATFLIDRQRRMQRLQAANAELQDKLKLLKVDVNLDLDTPITKVIRIIKSIQAKEDMDGEVIESLDYVIGILSSNKLFNIDLGAFKENIDNEVKSWLDNMLQAKETHPSPELNNGNGIAFTPPPQPPAQDAASTLGPSAGPASTSGAITAATSTISVAPGSTTSPASGDDGHAEPTSIQVVDHASMAAATSAAAAAAAAAAAGASSGMAEDPHGFAAIPEIIYKPVLANDTLIQQALTSAETWDFNCFELAQVTNGRPLYYFAQHVFAYNDFYATFGLDHGKVEKFFTRLEAGYRVNPYHNSIHAVDVMHGAHYFLATLGMSDLISIEERLACLLAASCHDVDHPGVSNAFLVETRCDLAVRYNDQSVLENHHAAKAFELLLGNNETNFLASLPKNTVQHLRQCMIRMVLATDMAMHYELHTKFKNKVQGAGINVKDVKDRQLLMEIAIKCADVSNPTRPPQLSQKWTELVMAEFYLQGDIERARGIPISRFMDRQNPGVGKCQIGFIEFVVLPLYETWDAYINEDDQFLGLQHLATNREFWKSYVDPPPTTPLTLSDIPTPDYLKPALAKPTVVPPFDHVFSGLPTVCNMTLPSPCLAAGERHRDINEAEASGKASVAGAAAAMNGGGGHGGGES
ncbi:cAMP-specific 3',5'-cyclic phosphodiesterase 4D [Blastocladiella emersonii ATCC 22665]|nr:cAMP-specific 3',5'-cyclic phosphodiesterase 4D [Blastocladiella emersonii ATCC 22665]